MMLCIRSKFLMDVSPVPVRCMADALFTTISIPPNVLTANSTASWIWDSLLTSTIHGRHFPPTALTVIEFFFIIQKKSMSILEKFAI